MLKVPKALVSADWLRKNIDAENLIVLNGTIPKVTAKKESNKKVSEQIKGSLFFDIKKQFSKVNAEYPNTVLSVKEFEEQAQELGINQNQFVVEIMGL